MRRRGLPLLTVVGALALAPAARGQDSLAPHGAPRDWLPTDEWVMQHWMPYDVNRLLGLLHTDINGIRTYFGGDRFQTVPPLQGLAATRGYSRTRLAQALMRPWRGQVTRARYRVLYRRATRTITQGHLLQHMLFHPTHLRAFSERSRDIFGADHAVVASMIRDGMSRLEIGAHFGRDAPEVRAAAERVVRSTARRGVRLKYEPRSEARREVSVQIAAIPAWLAFHGGMAMSSAVARG